MQPSPLGAWLREVIHDRHTTMRETGRYASLSHVTIHNIVWGIYTPSSATCVKLAEFLRVDPDEILELAGHHVPGMGRKLPEFHSYVRRKFKDAPKLRRLLLQVYDAVVDSEATG